MWLWPSSRAACVLCSMSCDLGECIKLRPTPQVPGRRSQFAERVNERNIPKKAEKSSKKLRLWLGQGERGEREPFVMPATGSEDQEPTPAAVIALFSRLLPPPATSVDSESRKPKGYYNNKKQPMSGPPPPRVLHGTSLITFPFHRTKSSRRRPHKLYIHISIYITHNDSKSHRHRGWDIIFLPLLPGPPYVSSATG